jgi:3-oxoacyl-(acyl-carrier-protein) synthase
MNLRIAGMGWVTPLGRGIHSVWDRLIHGDEATAQPISDSVSKKAYCAFRASDETLKNLPPHPRLRRASSISRFAAAAGLDALAEATLAIGEIERQRMALVFAASNGGVIYTKRFYHNVIESGAQSASPLLFPETVFNAPASHLAAILGIAGASYTVVGDGAVGVLAIRMASDLLDNPRLDACLIVGAEEADWILCDAYHKWRLLKKAPPVELFHDPPCGMILSEGAGAVLLARKGAVRIDAIDPGENFYHRSEANEVVQRILHRLAAEKALVIGSANGTFVDLAEQRALGSELPKAIVYSPKRALGESVGASAIWQTIVAAESLRTKQLPQMPDAGPYTRREVDVSGGRAIVLSCGLSQQAAGLRLST